MQRQSWLSPVFVGVGIFMAGFGSGFLSTHPTLAQPAGQAKEQCPPPPPNGCPPSAPCPDGKAIGPHLVGLLDQLKLTVKQEDAIDDLMAAEEEAKKAIFKKYKGDPGKARPELQAVDAKTRAAIEKVLTAAQVKKLAELEKELCKRRPKGPGRPGGPGRPPVEGPEPSGGYS